MPARRAFGGFTLIEMLVAVALSLLIMMAVVSVFGRLSAGVRDARAMAELADRLRNAQDKLIEDLRNATALQGAPVPPLPEDKALGYFEYIEGPSPRALSGLGARTANSETGRFDPTAGDVDDVLCFTIRSDELLRASVPLQNGGRRTVYSHYAEVCWFLLENRLVRLVRLVVPGADLSGAAASATAEVVPLELSQLALRHNRWGHVPQQGNWPNFFGSNDNTAWNTQLNGSWDQWLGSAPLWPIDPLVAAQFANVQQQVLLDNVLSFDVKVWDPQAPVFLVAPQPNSSPVTITPSSPVPGTSRPITFDSPSRYVEELQGWFQAGQPDTWQAGPVVRGTFVDLFYARRLYTGGNQAAVFHMSWFSGPGYGTLGQGAAGGMPAVYDTWTTHYEHDGWDQDGDGQADEGTNETNDANNAAPFPGPNVDPHLQNTPEADEAAEQEAPPPYRHPIRALQIKIRVFEPDTRQVREVTVIQAF